MDVILEKKASAIEVFFYWFLLVGTGGRWEVGGGKHEIGGERGVVWCLTLRSAWFMN